MRSRGTSRLLLGALAAAVCIVCSHAETAVEAAGPESTSILKSLGDAGVWTCARNIDGVDSLTSCLEGKARALFEETARDGEAQARSSGEYPMLEKMADMAAAFLPDSPVLLTDGAKGDDGALVQSERQQRSQRQEEELLLNEGDELGRGKKKKKKKALMKLLFVGMLIKNKLQLLFQVFGALLQIKFFGIAILQLLLTLFRLYLELAKKKEPQKVIYYEHAQHQHHYEHEHHYDDDHHKGWGGLWGRSYEEPKPASKRIGTDPGPDAQEQAYSNYYPRST